MSVEETILKLKMILVWRFHLLDWYREVWKRHPGDRMCCDGYMCGCMGADYYSYWERLWKDR